MCDVRHYLSFSLPRRILMSTPCRTPAECCRSLVTVLLHSALNLARTEFVSQPVGNYLLVQVMSVLRMCYWRHRVLTIPSTTVTCV